MMRTFFNDWSMSYASSWTTKMKEGALELKVNVAGLSREQLKLASEKHSSHYNKLILSKKDEDNVTVIHKFSVPSWLSIDDLKAECRNGLLTIVIPKKDYERNEFDIQ